MEETQQQCSNCSKMFDGSKVQLHEAYCIRNFKKCPECNEFIDKRELASHKEEKHTKQQCQFCDLQFNQEELAIHKNKCSSKPQKCVYCTLDIDPRDYSSHVAQCGARTKECLICQKSVILFDYDTHLETCTGESAFPSLSSKGRNNPIKQDEGRKPNRLVDQFDLHGGYSKAQKEAEDKRKQEQLQKQRKEQEARDDEYARRLQKASEMQDEEEIKKLQEEQDRMYAEEMMKEYSPKTQLKKKQSSNVEEYNYEAEYQDEEENDYESSVPKFDNTYSQEPIHQEPQHHYQPPPPPLQQPELSKNSSDVQALMDDVELQEAILRSQGIK